MAGPGRRREAASAASSCPGPGPSPWALRPDHASGCGSGGGGGDDFSLVLLDPVGAATIHGQDLQLRSENGVLALATPPPQPGGLIARQAGIPHAAQPGTARSCRPTSCWRSAQNLRLPQRLRRRRRARLLLRAPAGFSRMWTLGKAERCPVATCNKLFTSKHSMKTRMAKRHNLRQDLLAQLEAANSLTPSSELSSQGQGDLSDAGLCLSSLMCLVIVLLQCCSALANSGILTIDVPSVNSALAGNLPANNNNSLGQAVDPQALMATSDLPQSLDTSLFFGTTAAGFQQGPLDMDDVSSLSAGPLASLSSLAVKNSSQEPQDLTPSNKLTVDTDALTPSSTLCENSVSELLPPTQTEWNVHPDSDFFAQEEETQFGFANPAGNHGSQKETDLIIVTGSSFLACVEQDKLGQAFEDAFEVLRQHSTGDFQYSPDYKNYLAFINHRSHIRGNPNSYGVQPAEEPIYNWRTVINSSADLYFEGNIHQSLQNIPENQLVQPALLQQKGGKGMKKLRLFEYLHESLCNPEMASCIQWIDQTKGIFQFVSKNKEKLAQLWGKRKGNRKTMTYQKMARALRNYGRTGEIIKIRRKLTYQFSEAILQRLSAPYFLEKEIFYSQYVQPDQGYLSLNNWNANYNYTYANYYELSHPDC
ncbi:unnamed protein product [Rangifer tarandus platyrhynchus]|uniref:ETS domain-containing protein n=2 Tax=Rangifer tarandus platyrhynchus TaxID=3082113 RepID=A0ABN8YXY6_RANTA|nr:unnamed protein product [Rangifer tarandus platyrhynchus]CAI9694362.1 unnamed protein product [Rangifer tarandus platyrhynchus]